MGEHKIQWLNLPGYKGETWNPIIGCSKVSEGCANCYAEKMAIRLAHMPNAYEYSNVVRSNPSEWNGKTQLIKTKLTKPAHWKKPRVVFVCSMGDLFHESIPFEEINAVFSVMADNDQHIYIVLTKRPLQMIRFYKWKANQHGVTWQPSSNVWMGITAENQEQAEIRIPYLLSVNAAIRFVSIEPILGAIDLNTVYNHRLVHMDVLNGKRYSSENSDDGPRLDWVIVGGESGHNARPARPDWMRSIKDQCLKAQVPFFFKQWGEWKPQGTINNYSFLNAKKERQAGNDVMVRTGKKYSGNQLDGVTYEQYPKVEL